MQNSAARPAIAEVHTNRELVSFENMFPFSRTVLIFFIVGLLFIVPRARRTLGAYRIPRETGLLTSSVLAAYRKRARNSLSLPHIFKFYCPPDARPANTGIGRTELGIK
jgi:hypothetical protein